MNEPLMIGLITSVCGLLAAAIGAAMKFAMDRINQIERDSKARTQKLEDKVEALLSLDRIKDNYIADLRNHIWNGNPPPPPDWPAELINHR